MHNQKETSRDRINCHNHIGELSDQPQGWHSYRFLFEDQDKGALRIQMTAFFFFFNSIAMIIYAFNLEKNIIDRKLIIN